MTAKEKTKSSFWGALPIRFKVSLATMGILAFAILLVTVILFNAEKKILLTEMQDKGNLLVRNLAAAGFQTLVNNDRLVSSDAITGIMRSRGVIAASLLTADGIYADASLPHLIGKPANDDVMARIKNIKETRVTEIKSRASHILEFAAPILLEYKGQSMIKGYALVGVDRNLIDKAITDAAKSALILALILLAAGAVIAILLAHSITGPLQAIVRVMERVGEGDLEQSVNVKVTDEIGKLAQAFNEMIRHLKEKLMMSKYISKSAHEMISKKKDHHLELGGTRKNLTLFFSDIRGFTAFSEKRSPEEVIAMLNKYLSVQAEIITSHGGSIDKFVGDEVMGVFEGPDREKNAVDSAIEIQKTIGALNKDSKGLIAVGIGINTGEAVMGNMGSKDRMDYTVIGDTVNTAARFCSAAEKDQILISQSTYNVVGKMFKFTGKKTIKVKNKALPLTVYLVAVQ